MVISGQIIDIFQREIYPGEIHLEKGKIQKIIKTEKAEPEYILPGFIDAHIHIESSMLVPYEFARVALRHGTIATVSDPHEIANVCGMEGVEYMIENAKGAGLSFFFGAPSCVPATAFESAGATISAKEIQTLMQRSDIWYLSEMMNYPGVLYDDGEVLAKIQHARDNNKPIDGHAPGLKGDDAVKYIAHGISTDHECTTLSEALWKLENGMKILIREGSAAKNYQALESLIDVYPDQVMFCSDDKHPDDLAIGHINDLVKNSLPKYDLFNVLKIACVNPVLHYKLPIGLLRAGDDADFIVVKDIVNWEVVHLFSKGERLVENGFVKLPAKEHQIINNFNISPIRIETLPEIEFEENQEIIQAIDGSLITEKIKFRDCPQDELLRICVVNRYHNAPVAMSFITGFGKFSGALASSVAHDSHNIVAVGKNRLDMLHAINAVISQKGGLAYADDHQVNALGLPVGGLMDVRDCSDVAKDYQTLDALVKNAGCTLKAPFMTLSFMALLVIPKIKMSDLGLFDAERFTFINK